MSTRQAFFRRTLCNHVRHLVFIAVAGLAWPGLAAVAPHKPARPVEVAPPTCGDGSFQAAPFLDALRVELAGQGLGCCTLVEPGGDGRETRALRVTLEVMPCAAEAERILASVRDPSDDRVAAREIALSDVAATARPRTLALAVAELLRTLGQSSEKDAPPPPAAVLAIPAPPSPPSPRPAREAGVAFDVQAESRLLPTRSTTLWGGRARVTVPWRRMHAALDVGGGYASAASELGNVVLRTTSLGVAVGPRLLAGIAIIDLGLRAELGWAWIHGDAVSTDVRSGSGSGLLANAGLRATAALPAGMRIRPCLAVEGGGIVRGLKGRASGQAVLGMTGYYLLFALGMEVEP